MARSLWKGQISFGLVEIPVGLVSGSEPDELGFVQLDEENLGRIGYRRYNKESGEEVPYERIVKGYELDDGRVVVIEPDELARVRPEATSTIEIFAFVDQGEIDPAYYDQPYLLEPAGKNKRKAKAYALLRDTLRESGRVALARVVVRTRQHVAALVPKGDAIGMITLRYAHELRAPDAIQTPPGDTDALGVRESERKLARTLVDELTAHFEPETYHDDYRDAVLAYVKEKAEKGEVHLPAASRVAPPGEGAEVVDIMDLLKRSVAAAAKGAPEEPKRAAGGRKKRA